MSVRRIEDVYAGIKYLPHKICDALCANCGQPRGRHSASRPWTKGQKYDPVMDDAWCPEGDEGFSTTQKFRIGPEVLT